MQKYILQITLLSVLAMSSSGFLSAMDPADAGDPAKQPQPNVDTTLNLSATGVGLDTSTITASAGTTTTTTTTTTAITSTSTPLGAAPTATTTIVFPSDVWTVPFNNVKDNKTLCARLERLRQMDIECVKVKTQQQEVYNRKAELEMEAFKLNTEWEKANKAALEATQEPGKLGAKEPNISTDELKKQNILAMGYTYFNAACIVTAFANTFATLKIGLTAVAPKLVMTSPYAWGAVAAVTGGRIIRDVLNNRVQNDDQWQKKADEITAAPDKFKATRWLFRCDATKKYEVPSAPTRYFVDICAATQRCTNELVEPVFKLGMLFTAAKFWGENAELNTTTNA